MKRFLTTRIKTEGYNDIEVFQDKRKVRANGNFYLPAVLKEFKPPEEAKEYIDGMMWMAHCYGADISHYMKDIDV